MFLNTLIDRNSKLIEFVKNAHQNTILQPDSFILDIDAILENALLIKEEADRCGIKLFFMLKQIGRNPYIAKKLVEIGYLGAVVVDFREAQIMMKHHIPICHAGHLVQVPKMLLSQFIQYGIDYMTVYSIEKAIEINEVCKKRNRKQKILLKFIDDDCMIYPSQESGFKMEKIEQIVDEITKLECIEIAGVTAFPAFLYEEQSQKIEPLPNIHLAIKAAHYLEKRLQKKMERNFPSCSQVGIMQQIHELGGTQAEPGNSFTGTTPNNANGSAKEIPAMLYLSEISHHFNGKSYCYGGGLYARGKARKAIVINENEQKIMDVNMPSAENIDYYFSLEQLGMVSSTVILSFRTQIFDTRSQVALVEGLSKGKPRIVGIYDSQGVSVASRLSNRELEKKNKRCIVLVLDGLGIGETPDVSKTRPQDIGANTLKTIIQHAPNLNIPNLTKLGLLETLDFEENKEYSNWDESCFTRIQFAHDGADTFFGHHELMGSKPVKPIPQNFNSVIDSVYEELIKNGYKVEIVGEHKQQVLVVSDVLTVADNIECDLGSAFNITSSLDHVSFDEVVKVGKIVRSVVTVPRVIAFGGRDTNIQKILSSIELKGEYVGINAPKSGVYDKDYHCIHLGYGIDPQKQVPFILQQDGIETYLIGKVADIIENKKENTFSIVNTKEVFEKVLELMDHDGFICANVQETDLSGHSQSVEKYATILNIADSYISKIIEKMSDQDLFMIVADHGNDPMIGHPKHTREYVPLLMYGKSLAQRGKLEQKDTLASVGATVCHYFECDYRLFGKSILQ